MFEQGDGPNHRVALISDLVDYPEGAKEFVSEIVKFSQLVRFCFIFSVSFSPIYQHLLLLCLKTSAMPKPATKFSI